MPRASSAISSPERPPPRGRTLFLATLAGGSILGLVCLMFFSPLPAGPPKAMVSDVEIVKEYPHDVEAYCQGLIFDNGELLETTGLNGQSTVRRVELATGKVLKKVDLDKRLFGEGATLLDGKLFQVTWKTGEGFVYNAETFEVEKTFHYKGEGWGLTNDGKQLIMSDGSSILRFIDPKTLKIVKRLEVRQQNRPVDKLNELEFVDGEIYANIWYDDEIVRISPTTGKVLGRIDLSGLVAASGRADRDCVLNGIAWDAKDRRLFVTGKLWPKLYEIKVVPRQ